MPSLPPWHLVYNDPANANIPMMGVVRIGADSFLAINAGMLGTGTVFRSTDGGRTWNVRATLPGINDQQTLATRLPFGTPNAALIGGALWFGGVSYVRLTTDGGATWIDSTPDPADTIFGSTVYALVAVSASDWLGFGQFQQGITFASNVIVSSDGGASWSDIGVLFQPLSVRLQPILCATLLDDGSVVCGGFRPDAPDAWTTFRSLGPPWNVWTPSAPFPGTYPLGLDNFTRVLSIADCGGGIVCCTLGPGFTMPDAAGDHPLWVYRSTDHAQTWTLLNPATDIVNAPFFPAGSPAPYNSAGALLPLGGGQIVLGLGGFRTPGDPAAWSPGWRLSSDNGLTYPDQGSTVDLPGGSNYWTRPAMMCPTSTGVLSVGGGISPIDPQQQQIWLSAPGRQLLPHHFGHRHAPSMFAGRDPLSRLGGGSGMVQS